MAEMGRPKITINWDEFDKLCHLQCTLVEIAEWFSCSEDTIERRVKEEYGVTFAEHYKKKASKGKISLRRKQMDIALGGNVTMLIWLGKQYLGQSEKSDQNISIPTTNVTVLTPEERKALLKVARGED